MAKLYLGQENEKDVEDLLAQINDESILKMTVNTHQGTNGMRAPFLEDHKFGKDGIDPDLEARYASLKAPRPRPKEKGTSAGKSKQSGDVSSSPKRSSKGVSKVERSNSVGSDDVDSLDAELLARLQALKGPSVSSQVPEGESTSSSNSENNTPSLSEHLRALKSRSKKSPQMSPSRSDYPVGSVISVGSSGWCAPTSPFKLMKALSIKKPAPDHSGPVSRSPSKSQSSQTKDAKKAVKRSLSHTSKEEDQVDPSAMVADVQRLLAAVSREGRSERDQSTVKEAMIAGDKRAFNMKDRDVELLKALEDEEAIALEAEKVVAWAKDNARLEGPDEESEDELDELDVSCSDDSDDSAGAKLMSVKKKNSLLEDSDPEETTGKPKKRKGRRRWNFL
ncbi:hypothetical protein KC19_12G011100 [Ceratodon purpureus]|uniref:Uncharacterized protein n=1 Tax=Ceratodon purpureus TaxID=3225 RepID=A0A8T0G841_CERPU|nr:hypothetical protein KC19_12G011100 [Ceratodon purpureus]